MYLVTLSYFSVFGEIFSYYACTLQWIMLRNGTLQWIILSHWYGELYMIVVRVDPSAYIITLFPYDTVRYGSVPIPHGTVINYGTVRYGTVHVRYLYHNTYNSTYGVVQELQLQVAKTTI